VLSDRTYIGAAFNVFLAYPRERYTGEAEGYGGTRYTGAYLNVAKSRWRGEPAGYRDRLVVGLFAETERVDRLYMASTCCATLASTCRAVSVALVPLFPFAPLVPWVPFVPLVPPDLVCPAGRAGRASLSYPSVLSCLAVLSGAIPSRT